MRYNIDTSTGIRLEPSSRRCYEKGGLFILHSSENGFLKKVITVEMAVLALVSSAIGIPMSYVLGLLLVDSFAEVLFAFPVILAAGAMTTTFFLGVVFVLMSSMMPIRYSWKLDTEQTIRERTAG